MHNQLEILYSQQLTPCLRRGHDFRRGANERVEEVYSRLGLGPTNTESERVCNKAENPALCEGRWSIAKSILKKIKATNPVILNITNFVTMDFIANGLLSLGASPIMSQAIEEIESLVQLSSCVVINIGTLNAPFLELANAACYFANKAQKPIILDPVGAGATTYRTNSARQLLNDHKIQIIRGNASEIAALINDTSTTKGVDSTISMHDMQDEASKIAILFNATICVSGKIDLIVNTHNKALNQHGSPMMTRITGMGCLLTAVIGAFHAVEPDPFLATYNAALYYSLCGELAAQQASAPADFKRHFIDALYAFFPLKYAVSISEER